MTKGQIVTYFAEKFEISKKAAASIIDEYGALAIAETKKKGAFVLPGIGRSVLVKRKARTGRNPGTGEAIKIRAKTVVPNTRLQSIATHPSTPCRDQTLHLGNDFQVFGSGRVIYV